MTETNKDEILKDITSLIIEISDVRRDLVQDTLDELVDAVERRRYDIIRKLLDLFKKI